MKTAFYAFVAACVLTLSACCQAPAEKEHVIIAYVTSWTDEIPDPFVMTHINYAFGHVNDSFNGVRINNEERHLFFGFSFIPLAGL